MTAKTLTAKVAAASSTTEPSYTELLRRARALFANDVETRFQMAELFSKMLKLRSAAEVAEDTDMTPGGVERIARVADFWGKIRIKPDGAGKRPAPWFTYDRVALDPVIPDDKKQLIKRAAPTKGLAVVRSMIDAARRPELARVEDIVRGKRAAKVTNVKSTNQSRGLSSGRVNTIDVGVEYVQQALDALSEAIDNLDQLESVSQVDGAVLQDKISDLMKQYVRLTKVS